MKIAVFGNSAHGDRYVELKREADNLGVELDLIPYGEMKFNTKTGSMKLGNKDVSYYDVYFFRSVINNWEEANLIISQLDATKVVVDPMLRSGRQTDICKANQMVLLSKAGLPVPKTIYGSLDYLGSEAIRYMKRYPIIIKGSRGDRHEQVFKLNTSERFYEKIQELKEAEENGDNKYMLQEYIRNTEDYRVLVVGDKALGVMKRAVGENPRIKNVFERANVPESISQLAVNAAKVCGIAVAGVDIVFKDNDSSNPQIYEVNKSPAYDRFEEVTGVNVANEVVKFLAGIE